MPPKPKGAPNENLDFGRPGNTIKIALIGLPNVGKSLSFNLLTGAAQEVSKTPFTTLDVQHAFFTKPDDRFNKLVQLHSPKAEARAQVEIWDTPGLSKEAHEGDGVGSSFLGDVEQCDVFCVVVDRFRDLDPAMDVIADLEALRTQVLHKDVGTVRKLIVEFEGKFRQNSGLHDVEAELDCLNKARETLDQSVLIGCRYDWTPKELGFLRKYDFLTTKPCVYLVNLSESEYAKCTETESELLVSVCVWVRDHGGGSVVPFSAHRDARILELTSAAADESVEDKDELERRKTELDEYLEAFGSSNEKPILQRLTEACYDVVGVHTVFTCWEEEVRAWAVPRGAKAAAVAGVIGGADMETGFVSMEVRTLKDLHQFHDAGKIRSKERSKIVGRDYLVEDGDVIFVQHRAAKGTTAVVWFPCCACECASQIA